MSLVGILKTAILKVRPIQKENTWNVQFGKVIFLLV